MGGGGGGGGGRKLRPQLDCPKIKSNFGQNTLSQYLGHYHNSAFSGRNSFQTCNRNKCLKGEKKNYFKGVISSGI